MYLSDVRLHSIHVVDTKHGNQTGHHRPRPTYPHACKHEKPQIVSADKRRNGAISQRKRQEKKEDHEADGSDHHSVVGTSDLELLFLVVDSLCYFVEHFDCFICGSETTAKHTHLLLKCMYIHCDTM